MSETIHTLRDYARKDGAGLTASLLLHSLVFLGIFLFAKQMLPQPTAGEHTIPVALVAESEGPLAEPKQQRAAGITSRTPIVLPRAREAHHLPTGVAPEKTTPPADDLEMQLKALSRLRQPNADPRLAGNSGTGDVAQSGNDDASGGQGPYRSRDIIRAQILRRWSLDMARLGTRSFVVPIHVLLKPDGTVLVADIVEKQRYATDSVYRWIALSARNAVLLSSPLTLPAGLGSENLELTLRLDPRDALH